MKTVPNQRVITIHKEKCQKDFIQIRKDYLANALKTLENSYAAVYLYLYLAGNADGFHLAFSPQDLKDNYNMPISTTNDQFKKLVKYGYLVQRAEGSNQYDFYETPQTVAPKEEIKEAQENGFQF